MAGANQKRGICPDDAEPTEADLIELEARRLEIQARWTEADWERKACYDSMRPVEIPTVSVTEMAAGAFNGRRRSRKEGG